LKRSRIPVRNCSVIRKRFVVPNAYIQAPLLGAGWLRKRASYEIAPVRSSTQPATNRPACAVLDLILPVTLIVPTSSPDPWVEALLGDADRRDHAGALVFVPAPVNQLHCSC
jgi:hypothetical protein